MKNLIVALIAVFCVGSVNANGSYHNQHQRHDNYRSNNYARDAIVGAVILGGIYAIAEANRPVYVQPPVHQAPPVYVVPNREVLVAPNAPYGHHYENRYDEFCNCYRVVLVRDF
jgi:hypothetical protein